MPRQLDRLPSQTSISSVGFTDERMHIFLALDPEKTTLKRQANERIREVVRPIEMMKDILDAQEFEGAKTIIGLRS